MQSVGLGRYRVKASKYNYIGGCYGCCNEKDMMKEIYENGPIVIGFQVNMQLLHYSAGIFLQVPLFPPSSLPSKLNLSLVLDGCKGY